MTSLAAGQARWNTTSGRFLRGSVIVFPSLPKQIEFDDVFLHISSDLRFKRAKSDPQHVNDFVDSDLVVGLKRVAMTTEDSDDDDTMSLGESLLSEVLAESVLDVVGPRREYDNRGLSINGKVAVREATKRTGSRVRRDAITGSGTVVLIAGSREERDAWLLLIRARVASAGVWHDVCRGHAQVHGSQSLVRLGSFRLDESTAMSQREIVDTLLRERSSRAQNNAGIAGKQGVSRGEGSEDDVSDAALLFHVSVMLLLELAARVGSAATDDDFQAWPEGAGALQDIETNGKRVASTIHATLAAGRTGSDGASTDSVLLVTIDCWDALVNVEGTLLAIASRGTIFDEAKTALLTGEKALRDCASIARRIQKQVTGQDDDRPVGLSVTGSDLA